MKMNTVGIERRSNLVGERVAMGIDPAAAALVMRSLSRLYSDPEGAVIREYSTNARDATIEAGKSTPIEVTTPTALSPFFKVRDYGIGLTVDDIHLIYSQYGASTKRGSNDYNGQLGYGCKSALAYCDQFTVVSTKNGVTVTVVVARDADGGGTMTVLDTSSTGEKDGTEVQVPAKRDNAMLAKAEKLFSTWPKGTVLLNGKTPERFEGLRITDDIYVIEGQQSYAVMGGVTYPTDFNLPGVHRERRYVGAGRYEEQSNVQIMAFVPIGDVDFTPSREALEDTDVTKATRARVAAEFGRGITTAIQREVDAAPTPAAAVATIIKWNKYIAGNTAVSSYTYKGTPLPTTFKPAQVKVTDAAGNETLVDNPMLSAPFRNYGRTRSMNSRHNSVAIHDWPTTVWVANYKPEKFTAQHKDKLRIWADAQFGADKSEQTVDRFVMVYGPAPDSIFIDRKMVVEWDTIKAIKLASAPTTGYRPARIAGSFDLWVKVKGQGVEFKHGVPGDQIDQKSPIIWHQGNRYGCMGFANLLDNHMEAFTLVCLPGGRISKFRREVPAAITAQAACDAAYKAWLAKLTPSQRNAVTMSDNGSKESLKAIDPAKVKDPALKRAATDAQIDTRPLQEQRREFRRIVRMDEIGLKGWKNPLDSYPLYSANVLRSKPDHTYNYLNLVHAGKLA